MVDLPAGVVALDGRRIPFGLGIICRVATHGGGQFGISEDLGLHGVEAGHGGGTGGDGPCGDRIVILVDDPGSIALPGLLHRWHGTAGGLVGGASERVVGQDCLHDSVEGSHIGDRVREFPDCRLYGALCDKVCHILILLASVGRLEEYITHSNICVTE